MKAKDLAGRLMKHPDYEVEFKWISPIDCQCMFFDNIIIGEIREPFKAVVLIGRLIN
mgnify:CR=1 FL=1